MTERAFKFLATISVLCIIGLVTLGFAPGDHSVTQTALSTTLFGSVTAVAALVSPQTRRAPTEPPPGPG